MRPLLEPEGNTVYQTDPHPALPLWHYRTLNQFRRLQRLLMLYLA